MGRMEFYVQKVLECSSRYNYSNSYYYSPSNLMGKYEQYPSYGDFPESYCLRYYGNWWKNSESYQPNYRPQDYDSLGAEDFVTVQFEEAVIPKDVCVYEVFNPGAVVRIWGKILFETKKPWVILWEGKPQKLPHESRKFHPPILTVNHLIKTIRLEFNQSHLDYHYAVEAILLGGYQPASELEFKIFRKNIFVTSKDTTVPKNVDHENKNTNYFLYLPNEVMLHIFHFLDLRSLSRCARVNKRWNMVSTDALLYQNINLKPHWYLVNCDTIKFFIERCEVLKKLDLSWCGNDIEGFSKPVAELLEKNCDSLTHLSLTNCKFLDGCLLEELSKCTELVDLRLKNINSCFYLHYLSIECLNKLVCLDLTSSDVEDAELILFVKKNPNLKVLVLDLCENLHDLDHVIETIVTYNKKISTLSCWKTFSLSAEGVRMLGKCPNITELDFGWCFINKDPGDSLNSIAEGCPKLKRLILSEWRGLNDNLVAPIIKSCKELVQLDLLGIKNITSQICDKALANLPKLRLLDLCYCDSIQQEEANIWREKFPHVTIQLKK